MTRTFTSLGSRGLAAGLAFAAAAGAGAAMAADYPMAAQSTHTVVVQSGGVDGFALERFGYTGRGYPIYGYGGYIGPYYRNGCFGVRYDCGPLRPYHHGKHHHVR